MSNRKSDDEFFLYLGAIFVVMLAFGGNSEEKTVSRETQSVQSSAEAETSLVSSQSKYPQKKYKKVARVIVKKVLDQKEITQQDIERKKVQIASILDEGDRLLQ